MPSSSGICINFCFISVIVVSYNTKMKTYSVLQAGTIIFIHKERHSSSDTCGASSPLVMILAIRLHFLLLLALWIFFLSNSPTEMYWNPYRSAIFKLWVPFPLPGPPGIQNRQTYDLVQRDVPSTTFSVYFLWNKIVPISLYSTQVPVILSFLFA